MKHVSTTLLMALMGVVCGLPVAVAANDEVEARVRAWMPDTVAVGSGVFQYAVANTNAKGRVDTVFLWLPAEAEKIRGLVLSGDLMMEANFVVDPVIRQACADQSIGILFSNVGLPSPHDKRFEELTRRLDRFMFWSFGITVSVGALVVAAIKLLP